MIFNIIVSHIREQKITTIITTSTIILQLIVSIKKMSPLKNALICRALEKNNNIFSQPLTSMKVNYSDTEVLLKFYAVYLEITTLNLNHLDHLISLLDKDIKKHSNLNQHILVMISLKNDKEELETAQVSRKMLGKLVNLLLLLYQIDVLLIMIAQWIINNIKANLNHYNQNNNNKLEVSNSIRLIHSNFTNINSNRLFKEHTTIVIQLSQDIIKIIFLLSKFKIIVMLEAISFLLIQVIFLHLHLGISVRFNHNNNSSINRNSYNN